MILLVLLYRTKYLQVLRLSTKITMHMGDSLHACMFNSEIYICEMNSSSSWMVLVERETKIIQVAESSSLNIFLPVFKMSKEIALHPGLLWKATQYLWLDSYTIIYTL